MKKKLIYTLLLSMFLITFVGCGNNKEIESKKEVIKTISQDEISITGDFGKANKVEFKEVKDTEEFKTVASFGDIITGFACYDIRIKDAKSKKIQPVGAVKVSIDLSESLCLAPGNTYEVLYTNGGKVAKVNSEVNGDKITFETTHFSVYSIVKFHKENKAAVATIEKIPQNKDGKEMIEVKAVKHEHAYTETISKTVTCTEAGEKVITCTCGDSKTEEIPVIAHTFANYKYNNDATYEKDGTETGICSICGVKDVRTKAGTKRIKQVSKPTTPAPTTSPAKSPTPVAPTETEEETLYRLVKESGLDFTKVYILEDGMYYYTAKIDGRNDIPEITPSFNDRGNAWREIAARLGVDLANQSFTAQSESINQVGGISIKKHTQLFIFY